jgi:hypothetical protein
MSGMQGVYLTAAKLSGLNFIASPTSRSAIGADLLVTDPACRKAWSVQVKTNGKPANTWLLNAVDKEVHSDSHIYVFVNLRGNDWPDFYVVPSEVVAQKRRTAKRSTGTVWHWIDKKDIADFDGTWERVFGTADIPAPVADELGLLQSGRP